MLLRLQQYSAVKKHAQFHSPMNRIAIFGKPGGGKSTFARRLEAITGIKHYPLDLIEYSSNGERVSQKAFSEAHAAILEEDRWIIDGLGFLDSFWLRIDRADTLIYIDMPYATHYWFVTKRLAKGIIVKPEDWPEGSSIVKGTLNSLKFLRLSRKFWTPMLFEKITARTAAKTVIRFSSVPEMKNFLRQSST